MVPSVPPVDPEVANGLEVDEPVPPDAPELPEIAPPTAFGLELAEPVLPPVELELALVLPVFPDVAFPVELALALPELPPVAVPVAFPELPVM